MKRNLTDDAVQHFSTVVRDFHALYDESPAFRERFDIWRDILDRRATHGGLALDMGCGTGVFSFLLADRAWRVIGVDGAAEMVDFCEEQRRARGFDGVRFIQARLPAIDESVLGQADLLISSSLVEFIDDLDATLALFARVVKPGGLAVLSMPNALSLSRSYERLQYRLTGEPYIYRFIKHFSSPKRLRNQLAPRGFVLEETQYYAHTTRIAQIGRALFLPPALTEDLFVAVFRKSSGGKSED